MIFSPASRFGSLLAAVRVGWWKWLIAALVASLLSVPMAGAAPRERARTVGAYQRGPLARAASVPSDFGARLAIVVLQEVSKSQLPGGASLGRLLEQFGLGSKSESEIAGIKTQLGQIQSRLTALETEVTQLRAEVAQGTYSVLVGEASPLTAAIDEGMDDLYVISQMSAKDPTKANFTRATLEFIYKNLIEKPVQTELTRRITGEAGSDSLIKAFSKALKTRSPYWTSRASQQVLEVFNYYQSEEARLLLLRENYWTAHPETYSADYVAQQVRKVEQQIGTPGGTGVPAAVGTQEALLKPSLARDIIADTRTYLEWSYRDLWDKFTSAQATKQVEAYGGNTAEGWHLPSVSQSRALIQGWPGFIYPTWLTWLQWIDNDTGGALASVIEKTFITGVWASTDTGQTNPCSAVTSKCVVFSAYGGEDNQVPNDGKELYLLMLVKDRTQTYWW